MQKPDLPQNPSPAHPTRRDASTEPAELEIIVPTNPPALTPAAARALMHLLTELATRSVQPNPAATKVDPHHAHAHAHAHGEEAGEGETSYCRRVDSFMPLGARSRTSASADERSIAARLSVVQNRYHR